MLLSTGEWIEETDLAMHSRGTASGAEPLPFPPFDVSRLSLEEVEKDHIERVLRLNDYNRARTADALGISKKTLYLKIKRYELDIPV